MLTGNLTWQETLSFKCLMFNLSIFATLLPVFFLPFFFFFFLNKVYGIKRGKLLICSSA